MALWFWISFVTTLAAAGATVWTGATRRRRAHFVLAPLTVVLLTITILLTERLVRAYEFPPDEMEIHLFCAKSAAFLVLPILVTGLLLVKRPRMRRLHRYAVIAFLFMTVVATGTGIWVFSLATPR